MIDTDGFRPNVGIIVTNHRNQVLWARRVGQNSWQFPQGGIKSDEDPEEALFRELHEELGLAPECVDIVGSTRRWLRYTLPHRYIRKNCSPVCIGQKQIWYLLRMTADEESVCLDRDAKPEFDSWRWVNYWYPPRSVIFFKRRVYWQALRELAPLLGPGVVKSAPKRKRKNRDKSRESNHQNGQSAQQRSSSPREERTQHVPANGHLTPNA